MADFLEELVNDYNKKLHKLSQKESEEIKNEILSIAKDLGVDTSRLFADFDKKSAPSPKIDAQKSPIQREKREKRPASPKKEKVAIKPKEVAKKQVEKKSPEKPIKTEKKVTFIDKSDKSLWGKMVQKTFESKNGNFSFTTPPFPENFRAVFRYYDYSDYENLVISKFNNLDVIKKAKSKFPNYADLPKELKARFTKRHRNLGQMWADKPAIEIIDDMAYSGDWSIKKIPLKNYNPKKNIIVDNNFGTNTYEEIVFEWRGKGKLTYYSTQLEVQFFEKLKEFYHNYSLFLDGTPLWRVTPSHIYYKTPNYNSENVQELSKEQAPKQKKSPKKPIKTEKKVAKFKFDKKVGSKNKFVTYPMILKEIPNLQKKIDSAKDYGGGNWDDVIEDVRKLFNLTDNTPYNNYSKYEIFKQLWNKVDLKYSDPKRWLPVVVNSPDAKHLQEYMLSFMENDNDWVKDEEYQDLPPALQELPLKEKTSLRPCNDCWNKNFETWLNLDHIYIVHKPTDKIFVKVKGNADNLLKTYDKFKGFTQGLKWDIPISQMTDKHIKARKDFINAIEGDDQLTLANKPKRNYKNNRKGLSNKAINHLQGAKKVITSKNLTFSQKLKKLLEY